MNFNTWIRQPSTIMGLGMFGGLVVGGLSHLVTGNPMIDGTAAAVTFGLVHLGIDDHSAVAQAAGRLEGDVATAITSRNPAGNIVQTLEDAAALARLMQAASPVPVAPAVAAAPSASPMPATPTPPGAPPAAS